MSVRVKRPRRHDEPASGGGSGEKRGTQQVRQFGLDLPAEGEDCECRLIRYHVKAGDELVTGQLIASCERYTKKDPIEFRSPADGKVLTLLLAEDQRFDGSRDPVVELDYCVHNVVVAGLCAVCGRTITGESNIGAVSSSTTSSGSAPRRDTATVNVEGGLRLEVTRDEALNVRESTVTRLFLSKRLSLVLDLDHTLIHCTDDPQAMNVAQNAPASAHIHTFELDRKLLTLKLRPGLPKFLKTMKEQYFEMYVYTAGTRAYAQKVCSIIDPDGSVFGERIVSRDDTPELGTDKDLTRLFPVDDTMVVVVDDRDVWGGVANLLTCEPFHFFKGMHDVNNTGWQTTSGEEGSDPADEPSDLSVGGLHVKKSPFASDAMDPGLARVESILKQVHGKFFFPKTPVTVEQQLAGKGSDVKIVLHDIRMSVLRGCVIALDPATQPRGHGEVDLSRYQGVLLSKARACGARLMDRVDASTTHLISSGETELALYGKSLGIWVVRPEWLEKSEHFWQRIKEEPFSVFRTYGTRPRSVPPPSTSSSSSSAQQNQDALPPRPSSAAAALSPALDEQRSTASAAAAPIVTEAAEEVVDDDVEDFANELRSFMQQQQPSPPQ